MNGKAEFCCKEAVQMIYFYRSDLTPELQGEKSMFGSRPDGKRVKTSDPIVRLTPYIMTRRSDSQVFTTQHMETEVLTQYINEKRREGVKVSHMAILIAAWLRTVCEFPTLNRFVIGSQLYARNELAVSFVTIKGRGEDVKETVCKLYFDPTDTVFQVSEKLETAIKKAREAEENSMVNRLACALLSIPLLTGLLVGVLKLMDRWGIMPKAIIDASPFHTSLFISNMASLKMNSIYHHIYDFGSTSVFIGMGRPGYRIKSWSEEKVKVEKTIPMGVVIDERIMGGAEYGMAFNCMNSFLRHPERLEQPPERVKNEGVDFSLKEKYRNKM